MIILKNRMIQITRKILISLIALGAVSTPLVAQASEEAASDEEIITAYITVPHFSVSLYHRGRPRGSMTISVKMRISDDDKRAKALKYLPRLSNAFVMEATRLSIDFFDVNRPINLEMLGNGLQKVANKILGHADSQVLIANVIVNKR